MGKHRSLILLFKMQIKRNNKGQWAPGNNSGKRFTHETSVSNQNAKGNPPNKTSWKQGDTAMEKHPQWKGGIEIMKKDCAYVVTGPNKRERRPHHVWKQFNYGEIPKGYIIWHKDGNRYNDKINNLELITRGECARRNKQNSI